MNATILAAATAGITSALSVAGETISYTARGSEPASVTVIWSAGDTREIAATAWTLAANLPAGYAKGDQVTRGAITYEVAGFIGSDREIHKTARVDDVGAITLVLRFLMETPA